MPQAGPTSRLPARKDGRIIIHFDYDCFYASVFEAENPALKSLPLAVQQKQIIVTCNYEARRRGLYKLQLVKDAKLACPDVVIVLGEDLTRFRNASKALYTFLSRFSWNNKAERLGFDEVWMDVTDIVDYNIQLVNKNDLSHSFFNLSKDDPTIGFPFDASLVAGHVIPDTDDGLRHTVNAHDNLSLRLCIGSHLALYLRHALEEEQGYTSTVGISTSKLLSKLIGNVNKPKGQTTLLPPYGLKVDHDNNNNNVTAFLDPHEIGKIPNIGFKQAQKLREFVLGRPAKFHAGLIYGKTQESVTVRDVRLHPDMAPALLDKVLGGPGTPHGVGTRIWELVNGVDDTEVHQAKRVPSQISIEDSYIRLDTFEEATKELHMLSMSLIKRMHLDLLEDEDGADQHNAPVEQTGQTPPRRWLALPRTLRLSTRPRAAPAPDWTRSRAFNRISRSAPVPGFLFNLDESDEALADKLVHDAWLPLFRKIHPEKSGWNLSLVNVAVTNMTDTASDDKNASGRDIGKMFKMQDQILREWRVEDVSTTSNVAPTSPNHLAFVDGPHGVENECVHESSPNVLEGHNWEEDEDSAPVPGSTCETCGLTVPSFAMSAHRRYHLMGD
ncbi:DNA/RNA polymerase [Viridothelium virens]|uniref:DNA/RNA polymerase n=1 Tax=Viridothelium virens TaxID=1048519 RepID=A0A6A6HGG2_VIRVR|nr:DNA/RNA polymerase [Viridothelium virens]